jgi:hypothetical protein
LNGIFGAVNRSREQSGRTYEPHVVVLDQSIERLRETQCQLARELAVGLRSIR